MSWLRGTVLLALFIVLLAGTAFANLSVTSQWRIEQAVNACEASGNALRYPDYWGDAVTDENRETLCMAEEFSDLVVMDGDNWLNHKAVPMITKCREKSKEVKNKKERKPAFYACLKENLDVVTRVLSAPCKELGAANLWDAKMCRRLISYIFISKFERVMEKNLPILEKIQAQIDKFGKIDFIKKYCHPVMAIILLVIFVFDVALLIDPGNWMRASKVGMIMGLAILGSCFTKGGMRHFISACVMAILFIIIIWNHIDLMIKIKKGIIRRYR